MPTCPDCGRDVAPDAKFCAECGARLSAAAPAAEVRKTVTALFCDVTGSTAFGEANDPETVRAVMARYFDAMRTAVERHGGTVEKFIGDAVVAFFGIPVVHEDDAVRAVRAAVDMQAALDDLADELDRSWGVQLAARIGLNTGEVIVTGATGTTLATGDAVNVAARLEQAAAPGEVLVGEATRQLARDLVDLEPVAPLELKGKSEPVAAWRVVAVREPRATRAEGDRRSPLVGRDRELALLRQALERCAADRTGQLFTVLGTAGVGKTRLLEELDTALGPGTTMLTGRCLSYGDGVGFWPLLEMLRASIGLSTPEDDADGPTRLAALLADDPERNRVADRLAVVAGLPGTPPPAAEVGWAVRRWAEALGRTSPLVLTFDDMHWGEPELLDVVEELTDWIRDAAVLVVCLARPEFLDDHPQWGGGKLNATTVLLEPLGDDDARHLVTNLLGGAAVTDRLRARVAEAAGGNPLFVEQMLAMLADADALDSADDVPLPPTIAALLTARLDRLPTDERAALEAAAVVGQVFYQGAVGELTGEDPRTALRALTRKELVRPDRSDVAAEDGFRFRHILVRDSAYHGIPKARRADLHERFAAWLDKRADALAGDPDEFVGFHLAEAVSLRRQLGPLDHAALERAHEAADRLTRAAARVEVTDPRAAARLYGRVAELLDGPDRLRAQFRQGFALLVADPGTARELLGAVAAAARAAGDEDLTRKADVLYWLVCGRLETSAPTYLDETARTLDYFLGTGDDEGIAFAAFAQSEAYNMVGLMGPMADACALARQHAAKIGNRALADAAQLGEYQTLVFGPLPAAEARQRVEELETQHPNESLLLRVAALHTRAVLAAMDDDADAAAGYLEEADRITDELHQPLLLVAKPFMGGIVSWILDDPARGQASLEPGMRMLEQQGETAWLSTLYAMLADTYYRSGEYERCAEATAQARAATPTDDTMSNGYWRALQARLDARAGRADSARRLAAEAVEWLERADQVLDQGFAHQARGEVLELLGDTEPAAEAYRTALDRFEAKGSVPLARRTRQRLAALTG